MPPAIDFFRVFELSPNAYMMLDRDLRYVAANPAYLRLTASKLEDLLGRNLFESFPNDPKDPENASAVELRQSFERVLARKAPDTLALIRYRVPKQTAVGIVELERYWSATHTPYLDERGEVAFIIQHTEDVTELQRLREQGPESRVLERAEKVQEAYRLIETERSHLLRLFAQAPGFVTVLRGPQHVFELANDAYLQLVGHREIIGKPLLVALPEVADQGFVELLDKVYRTGEPFVGRGVRVVLQRTPGAGLETRTLDFVYQPVRAGDGQVVGIFVQGQDITAEKELEAERERLLDSESRARAQAEEANRLKDEFLATVSHELRTPLSAMLGWAQLLRSRSIPDTQREHALETIERNARAQARLVEDLLDVSRILSGKLALEVEPLDLGRVVAQALETVRPGAEAKGIRLVFAIEGVPSVLGDAQRLQQVAWNLLANAVKFTARGGHVRAHVERLADAVQLTVTDDGQGIAPEFLPFVFERFRQEKGGASRSAGGLGLGLSIVRQLVEMHGGSVSVSSEGPGKGATFVVRLPTAAAARAAAPDARVEPPAELAGLRILVVEDEADTRELVCALLEACGAKPIAAASAPEALAAFEASRPHLVVSDIGMPNEDGYSLIRKIRARGHDQGGDVPAVALTAFARPQDRSLSLSAGFTRHLAKPVEPVQLLAVLASLARHRSGA